MPGPQSTQAGRQSTQAGPQPTQAGPQSSEAGAGPSGTRPRASGIALLCAAALAACANEAPGPAPSAGAEERSGFDPLADAARGRVRLDGARVAARSLVGADPLEPRAWRLAADLLSPADAEVDGRAARTDAGLELAGPHVAALRMLPLDPEVEWLAVSAELSGPGREVGAEQGYARFGVLQVELDRLPADLAQVPARILDEHFSAPLTEPGATASPVEFAFARDPRARGLLLLLENTDPAGVDARALLAGLRVESVGAQAVARAAAEEYRDPTPADGWPADRPRYGRFEADLVHRHGVALPPSGRLTIPVEADVAGWDFEAFACVLGPDHPGEWALDVGWSGSPDPPSLARATLTAEPDDDPATALVGWTRIAGRVPGHAQEGDALTLSATGPDAAPPGCALVVAGARLTPPGPPTARPNLLFVSLDTLRADHVGVYGDPRPITPQLDALAERARVFTDTWANAPYTLPSHLSMLSGQFPTVHGVQRPTQRRDSARTPLLAEALAAVGYRTAAFTGGAMVLPRFGLADGFERYGVLDPWINLESERTRKLLSGLEGIAPRAFGRTGPEAIEAELERFGDEPWFLFVHTYAAHEFDPPPAHLEALGYEDGRPADDPEVLRYLANQQPPPPELRRRLEQLYAGGVRHADALVGELVALLERRGQLDSTLIVVTSDHGKEIGEHGMVGHGHVLYGELVRVPLLLAGPGVPPGRDAAPAQSVDLVPTVLGLLGVDAPDGLQGRDLLAAPPGPERTLWAEVDTGWRLQALRRGGSKTIRDLAGEDWEHFELGDDPDEMRPLDAPAEARTALSAFAAGLEALAGDLPREDREAAGLDAGDRAHLEALGYVLDEGLMRGSRTSDPER